MRVSMWSAAVALAMYVACISVGIYAENSEFLSADQGTADEDFHADIGSTRRAWMQQAQLDLDAVDSEYLVSIAAEADSEEASARLEEDMRRLEDSSAEVIAEVLEDISSDFADDDTMIGEEVVLTLEESYDAEDIESTLLEREDEADARQQEEQIALRRKQEEEDEVIRKQEQEAALMVAKKAADAAADIRKQEEEIALRRKQEEEDEVIRKQEQEAALMVAKKAADAAADIRKQEEQIALRRKQEKEDEVIRKQEQEAALMVAKKAADAAADIRKQEEEIALRRKQEEEDEVIRKQEQEAALMVAKKAADAAADIRKQEEIALRRKQEEEDEVRRKQEQEAALMVAKKAADAAADIRKQEEIALRRKQEKEDEVIRKQEQEAALMVAKKAADAAADIQKQEEIALRRKQEEEDEVKRKLEREAKISSSVGVSPDDATKESHSSDPRKSRSIDIESRVKAAMSSFDRGAGSGSVKRAERAEGSDRAARKTSEHAGDKGSARHIDSVEDIKQRFGLGSTARSGSKAAAAAAAAAAASVTVPDSSREKASEPGLKDLSAGDKTHSLDSKASDSSKERPKLSTDTTATVSKKEQPDQPPASERRGFDIGSSAKAISTSKQSQPNDEAKTSASAVRLEGDNAAKLSAAGPSSPQPQQVDAVLASKEKAGALHILTKPASIIRRIGNGIVSVLKGIFKLLKLWFQQKRTLREQ